MRGDRSRRRRMATILLGPWLLLAPVSLPAQNCFDQAPSLRDGQDVYAAIEPTRISSDDRKAIENLFKQIKGRWAGDAHGYFCRGKESAPRREADDFRVATEATVSRSNELSITSDMIAKDNKTRRTEKLRLILSDNSLRVNSNDPGGEVKILELSRSGKAIAFVHKAIASQATGGVRFTEIVHRITVSGTTMTMEFYVYLRGGLTSSSTWKLKKK